MDQKNEQKAPLRIKNLAELKRCIRPGTELVATSHMSAFRRTLTNTGKQSFGASVLMTS